MRLPARGDARPSSALDALARALLGTWALSGDASGVVRYEEIEGGRFLAQHVDVVVFGRRVKGLEMIGHLIPSGQAPSDDIASRFYSFLDGQTLDYLYEIDGRNLTIFFTRKDSGNLFRATFSDDGRSYAGAWSWPGGGYQVRAQRIG